MDVAEEQAACPAIAVGHLSKSIGRHGVLGDIIQLCYADARELSEPHRMAALEL